MQTVLRGKDAVSSRLLENRTVNVHHGSWESVLTTLVFELANALPIAVAIKMSRTRRHLIMILM